MSFDKLKFNIVHDKPEMVNVSRPLGVMDIEDNKYIFKSHEKMELIFRIYDPNLCVFFFLLIFNLRRKRKSSRDYSVFFYQEYIVNMHKLWSEKEN